MELTFYEDPACTWCWAFQPVSTAFAFEFGETLRPRRVMGGLRDWPVADVGFVMGQWKKAEAVSGMPFESRIWKRHVLRTTFVACRAVKAGGMIGEESAHRLLRRLREALFVEQTPIDDVETILRLGGEVGIDREQLKENIASGRAETLFARDRSEAAQYGFGFPTIVLRDGRVEHPVLLQGAVPYTEVLQTIYSLGVSPKQRRRFRDTTEHWATLFTIHRRLTLAEILKVTQMDQAKLIARLEQLGIEQKGVFYEVPGAAPCDKEIDEKGGEKSGGEKAGGEKAGGEKAGGEKAERGATSGAVAASPTASPGAPPAAHVQSVPGAPSRNGSKPAAASHLARNAPLAERPSGAEPSCEGEGGACEGGGSACQAPGSGPEDGVDSSEIEARSSAKEA